MLKEGGMPRHLVIDDMQVRHDEFDRILVNGGHSVDHAFNVAEGLAFLREAMLPDEYKAHKQGIPATPKPYGVIFLDHDIDSGYDRRDVIHFVRGVLDNDFLREEVRKAGTLFFIHSHNPEGAVKMASLLVSAGFSVMVKPFKVG